MAETTSNGLRVLFVGIKWPPETFLTRLMRGLAERGVHVTLTAPNPPDDRWHPIPNVDVFVTYGWSGSVMTRLARTGGWLMSASVHSLPETRRLMAIARKRGSTGRTIEALYRWLPFAGHSWDVIYFPWNATAISYYPLMDKSPSVISCRGTQVNITPHHPQRTDLREGLAATFRKATAVHCVSEAIRDEALKYGLDKAKSVVIRPAVDPEMFRLGSTRPTDGLFRVISTGSVIWRKGYEYALAAVRDLVDRGVPVQFEIIGRGDEDQRLLYTIQDMDLDKHVVRHGALPPAEVLMRLQQADVFLLTSLSEGISNAVLEGMACGLPVVTTDAGGMAEAISDGVEGFLVPARDPAATSAALLELWRRPVLRRQMGAAGRERVLRDFRLSDQADAFVDLFRSVA